MFMIICSVRCATLFHVMIIRGDYSHVLREIASEGGLLSGKKEMLAVLKSGQCKGR
jgi:hypothetical protein